MTKPHKTPKTKKSAKSNSSQTPPRSNTPTTTPDVKTSKRAGRYLIIGTTLTIFNYASYAVLANLIIDNNNLLWLSAFISTALTTILAYILHSKITWKERHPDKIGVYNFFIWNILLTVIIHPFFTQIFSYITPLYDFTFNLTSSMHIPFTYEFILTTGAFALTAIVTMILNYLFYDKFVFGKGNLSKPKH